MNASTLQSTLRRAGRLKLVADVARAAAITVAVLIAAVALSVVIDAVLALNVNVRMVANALLIALALVAGGFIAVTAWRDRYDARRIARYVERQARLPHNRLINAVDLASQPATGGTSEPLRRMAVEAGERASLGVEPARIVDRRPMRRAALLAAVTLIALALAALLMPRLFAMVLPRFLDPAGDHPPFTLVDFDIAVTPDRVYRGHPATISATLTGPIVPEEASVVFVDSPETARRVPMLPRTGGRFDLHIDRAAADRVFYIDTPHGRSKRHTLRVLPVPTFEQVLVRYEYPAYTGWTPSERALSDAGIDAITGTTVTLRIDSNLPLRRGAMRITGDGGEATDLTLAPAADRPTNVAGSFTLTRSGTYELSLEAADGTPSDAAPTGPVVARPDESPRIQLLEPDLRLVAPVGWKVRASFAASDDVAVDRVFFYHTMNDGPIESREMMIERSGPQRANASHTLDLAALGAKPGDVIKGFATVVDNDPAGPKRADSPAFEVRVVSAEEYAERARERYHADDLRREFEQMMDQMAALDAARQDLADRAEELRKKVAAGASLTESEQAELDELRTKLAEFADAAEKLAERMAERAQRPPLYEFEKPVQQQLAELAAQLAQEAAQMRGHHDRLPPPSEQKLDDLLADLRANMQRAESDQQAMQATAEQLEKLDKADAMLAAAAELLAIAEAQRELADRLDAARQQANALDPTQIERMQQMAREQETLAAEMAAALDALEEAAADGKSDLPRMSASAEGLVEKIRGELRVGEDQREAAERAQLNDAAGAHAAADRAATKLESLITEESGGGLGGPMIQDLDGALGLSRAQLAAMTEQMSRGQSPQAGRGGQSSSGGERGDTLVGPNTPQQSAGASEASETARATDAFSRADAATPPAAGDTAQRIDPRTRDGSRTAPGDADLAPARYRPLIDAYFKRLADDSR